MQASRGQPILRSAATYPASSRIDRARQGDRIVIGELYAELAPGVVGYLRGGGARDPEDLGGDVFVSMMRGLATFEGDEAAFRRWVFTIAHNRLVDARRRHEIRSVGSSAVRPSDCAQDDPSDRVLDLVDAAPIVRALSKLTAEQRDAVLLRSVAGLSVADTATVLQKPTGAIKTLHRRGLASLARHAGREAMS